MKWLILLSMLPLLICVLIALLLLYLLANRVRKMRRTYTIKSKRGLKLTFVVEENEDFELAYRRALERLRYSEHMNDSGRAPAL